jgi:BMFP domain-containing protein YqiC
MTGKKDFLDDMARLAGGAASLVNTMRRQMRNDLHDRVNAMASRMDMAERTELEHLRAMVAKYRAEQESMKSRIAALEKRLAPEAGKDVAKKAPDRKKPGKTTGTKRG